MSTYDTRPVPRARGPLFTGMDIAAGIAVIIMNLGPLAMAAFWAPYH